MSDIIELLERRDETGLVLLKENMLTTVTASSMGCCTIMGRRRKH